MQHPSPAALPSFDEILERHPGWLDEGIDTGEAARFTGFAKASLETMRVRGGGPEYSKRGSKVVYSRRSLLQWLGAGRRRSTSDAA